MTTIKIEGMKCQHCVSSVRKALESLAGVANVSVNLELSEASYTAEPSITTEIIKKAINKIGFEVVNEH